MAFTLIQSDTFTRATTTASANPGSVGNSWTDVAGSVYNISSNQLQGTSTSTSGYATQILGRPSSEQYQDQRVLINFPGSGQSLVSGSTVVGAVARYQVSTGNHYEAVVVPSTTTGFIYKVVGGVRTQLTSIACTGWDPTHSYSLNLDATGNGTTTLVFTLVDTTSVVTRGTGSITDTETTLQNATGVSAVSCWSVSSGSGTSVLVTSVATSYQTVAASALTLTGPTGGAVSTTSSTFTVAANGAISASTPVTLNDAASGVFSPTSVTLTAGSPSATFTYTPSATAGTYTITSSASGLTSATKTYTSTGAAVAATALTISGPASGSVSTASANFTVSANGTLATSKVVSLSTSATGTFTPSSITLTSSTTSATFTYTGTTITTTTLTAAATGLTSGTSSYSTVSAAYNPANYTGTTPATFTPLFGSGGPIEARVLYEQKSWFDWANTNGLNGRLIVTEMGIPTSSNPVTDPQSSYSTETYNPGWENVMQQWYEAANRAGVHVTAWNAGEWRVGLASYLTDDGTHKPITHRGTASSIIENNLSSGSYQRGVAMFGADASDGGPIGSLNRGHVSDPGAAYYYASAGTFQALAARGITLVRLATRWERFQPTLKAALDPVEMALLDACLAGAASAGIKVLLDIHNYARYDTTPTGANANGVLAIGQNAPAIVGGTMTDCFVDLWSRLSTRYKGNTAIWGYDLCNEPHDLPGGVGDWQNASRLAVEAIRVVDQSVYIAVEGYSYATVTNWVAANGATPWLTETIPAGQIGAGSARNTDAKVLFNGHHYFDTTPNGNDGSYRITNGGGFSNEVTYATSSGFKSWSTSGYTAPATNNTLQTGVRTTYKTDFSSSPGTYSAPTNGNAGSPNGLAPGSNTITAPFTGVGNPAPCMKIVCSTTSDEGSLRKSLTGTAVSRVGAFDFQVDSSSSSLMSSLSSFNILHCWSTGGAVDFVEIRINGSGGGYTFQLAIPGAGGATATGTTVFPVGSFQNVKIVVTDTNFQLFLNGSSTAETTLTATNTGLNIEGIALGKFYGNSPLTIYYDNVLFGRNATYYAPPNGGLLAVALPTPTVTLSSNVTSGTAPQSLTLSAIASEPGGTIAKIDFYQGGANIGTTTSTPYTLPVASLAAGTYGFTAIATDANGSSATSNVVTVIVAAGGGGVSSIPSVGLSLNFATGVAPASVTMTATPSTTSGYVTLVEFFSSSSKIGQSSSTPWSFTQSALVVGSYQFSAKVTDNSGNTAVSTVQTYTVVAGAIPTVTPPTIALNLAVTNPIPPASLTLSAAAAATNATVQSVSFYQGATLLATQTAAPFSYGIAGLAAGTYTFTAVVTDSKASQTTSSAQNLVITPSTIVVTGGGGTPTATSQEITANTQGTLLDIKQYVANQWGRNDATVRDSQRDNLIEDAKHAYYASRKWSFLLRNGFVFFLSIDPLYPTILSAPLPANRNRAFDLEAVYDSRGIPIKKHTVDQLLLASGTAGSISGGYAIDENRNLMMTNLVGQATILGDYWMLPKRAKLDGSEDLVQELATNLTAIKYLAMSLNWMAGERDETNFNVWQQLYQKQHSMDVRNDAQNMPVRQFLRTPRNTGYSRRGGQNPPTGYQSRYY